MARSPIAPLIAHTLPPSALPASPPSSSGGIKATVRHWASRKPRKAADSSEVRAGQSGEGEQGGGGHPENRDMLMGKAGQAWAKGQRGANVPANLEPASPVRPGSSGGPCFACAVSCRLPTSFMAVRQPALSLCLDRHVPEWSATKSAMNSQVSVLLFHHVFEAGGPRR